MFAKSKSEFVFLAYSTKQKIFMSNTFFPKMEHRFPDSRKIRITVNLETFLRKFPRDERSQRLYRLLPNLGETALAMSGLRMGSRSEPIRFLTPLQFWQSGRGEDADSTRC